MDQSRPFIVPLQWHADGKLHWAELRRSTRSHKRPRVSHRGSWSFASSWLKNAHRSIIFQSLFFYRKKKLTWKHAMHRMSTVCYNTNTIAFILSAANQNDAIWQMYRSIRTVQTSMVLRQNQKANCPKYLISLVWKFSGLSSIITFFPATAVFGENFSPYKRQTFDRFN